MMHWDYVWIAFWISIGLANFRPVTINKTIITPHKGDPSVL
jgi:hypothetical protein